MLEKLETSQKVSLHIGDSYNVDLKSVEGLYRIFLALEYWFKIQNAKLVNQTKPFFWKNETNLGILQKVFPSIEFSYRLVLKTARNLILIFWVIEYWFLAWKYQIYLTNTKPHFWKSEAKLETFKKLYSHVEVS